MLRNLLASTDICQSGPRLGTFHFIKKNVYERDLNTLVTEKLNIIFRFIYIGAMLSSGGTVCL